MLCTYLDAIDDAAITGIEGVHAKDEEYGLEDDFAGVAEDGKEEEKLGGDDEDYLGGGEAHDQHRDHQDDYYHHCAGILVQLMHGCSCIV